MTRLSIVRARRSLCLAVVLALAALATGAGIRPAHAMAPTPVFASYLNYPVGTGRSVAVGDFTGDGRTDVVLSTEESAAAGEPDHVYLFAQGADGWLAQAQVLETDLVGTPKGGLAAGDLDGDGLTDVVLPTGQLLDLFFQRGGRLEKGAPIALPGVQEVEVADVDGDGRADLVVNGGNGLAVLRGTGGGVFAPPVVLTPDPQVEVAVGDVTGDGRPDLVTCASSEVRVFPQAQAGTFSTPTTYAVNPWCESVALADVNGDHRLDVAVVGGGNVPLSRLGVLVQSTDGTLSPAQGYATADIPGSVKAGDMNGDGLTDLVVLHENWMEVGVHAQAPDHSLDPERLYSIPYANGGSPKALTVGDVNGDHRPDIVIADDSHGLVVLWGQPAGPSTTTSSSVLPTTVPAPPPTGSPPPVFSAVQAYAMRASGASVAVGDFDGDGRNDVAMASDNRYPPDTGQKLFVSYQGADGALRRAVTFDTDAVPWDHMVVAAGDVDGDGRTDLVVRTLYGIDVFLQRGGTFADRKYTELPQAERIDLADLDGDGRADLIMTGADVTVSRSLGSGTFAPPVTVVPGRRHAVAVGDVTGDGRLDLVADDVMTGAVDVFAQQPDGTFASIQHAAAGGPTGLPVLGDFNGDGRLDVAVSHGYDNGPTGLAFIRILLQGPDGQLLPLTDLPATDPGTLATGDVDGDGRTDLVVLYENRVGVRLQQPTGELGAEQSYPVPAGSHDDTAMALADVTGDGRLDVAVADPNQGLDVLRNVAPGVPSRPAAPATYHAVTPARILDTRIGLGASIAPVGPGATLSLQVAGKGGVPATGVRAVVLNVTVTGPTAPSFLTAWPSGEALPPTANLTYVAGQTVPNLVVVKVGADGRVNLRNSSGSTHVVADVAGWYSAATGARFTAVTPARLLDTRIGVGAPTAPVGPGGTLPLQVTGRGGVPATGVSAVVLNVTVTGPTAPSFLTAWPSGEAVPPTANLTYVAGQTVPNLVVVKVGADGKVNLRNNVGSTDVVADVTGWYGTDGALAGARYTSLTPARILDTRIGLGAPTAAVGPGGTLSLQVAGRGGVPAAGVSAVVLNVTVTGPTAPSFLTAWPSGEALPPTANLTYVAGQTVPNLVIVKVGPDGKVDLRNNAGSTQIVADVAGWYGT